MPELKLIIKPAPDGTLLIMDAGGSVVVTGVEVQFYVGDRRIDVKVIRLVQPDEIEFNFRV